MRRSSLLSFAVAVGARRARRRAAGARAADPVKIGILWPLTGNAAAAGQASRAAIEVALDIINNAHPELGNLPLAATAGLPNLGGAKIEVTYVDHEGNPSTAQQLATRLITQDKVDRADGRLSVVVQLHRHRGRRALRHSLHGRRIVGAQHHRPRLQVDLPRHADRHRLCPHLYAVLCRHEEAGQEDRQHRHRQREHRLRHLGRRRHRRRGQEGQSAGRDPHSL